MKDKIKTLNTEKGVGTETWPKAVCSNKFHTNQWSGIPDFMTLKNLLSQTECGSIFINSMANQR